MVKSGKSRAKMAAPAAARAKTESKKAGASRASPAKPAGKRTAKPAATPAAKPHARVTTSAEQAQLDAYIAAASQVLALPVEPEWLPAIRANLAVTLRMGTMVTEFALPDEAEPAPVFEA
jgi:hypothetical protein